jgi:hypothetical protein
MEYRMRSFRLISEVIEYIDHLAEKTGRNKSEVVEQAVTKAYRAYSASKIWGFGSDQEINLMLADFPEQAIYKNPAFEGSLTAIGILIPSITIANEGKTITVHMHYFHTYIAGNLLLVGGPKRNNVTKFFLEETELKEKATFDDWVLRFDGEEYAASFDDPELAKQMDKQEKICSLRDQPDCLYDRECSRQWGGLLHVEKDYGLLLKAPNPLNTENTVMIIAGCRGFGTGGAASVVADRKMSKDIVKELGEDKCQYFRAVVEVLVRNDVIAKREIVKLEALDKTVSRPYS